MSKQPIAGNTVEIVSVFMVEDNGELTLELRRPDGRVCFAVVKTDRRTEWLKP